MLLALSTAAPTAMHGRRAVIDENGRLVRFEPGGARALYMATGAGEYLLVGRRPAGLLTSRSPVNERLLASPLLHRALPGLTAVRLALSSSEGAAANVETLIARKPDVLITWGRLVPRFARVGIAAIGLRPVASPRQFADHARLYGALTGRAAQSAILIARSAAAQAAAIDEIPASIHKQTRVVFLYWSGASWRANFEYPEIVTAAGGIDPLQGVDRSAILDPERLLALAPKVIVIVGGERVADDAALRLLADPRLAGVPAVAARRVYRRPPGLTGYMGSVIEAPIYQRWLAEVLHPTLLAPLAREMTAATIERELRVRASDAELDEVLGQRSNRASAHASRFGAAP